MAVQQGGISHAATEVGRQDQGQHRARRAQGQTGTLICQDYHISQAQYYQGRDQFLSNAPKAFEVAQQTEREARLQHENA